MGLGISFIRENYQNQVVLRSLQKKIIEKIVRKKKITSISPAPCSVKIWDYCLAVFQHQRYNFKSSQPAVFCPVPALSFTSRERNSMRVIIRQIPNATQYQILAMLCCVYEVSYWRRNDSLVCIVETWLQLSHFVFFFLSVSELECMTCRKFFT